MLCNALIMHTRLPLPSHPHSALLSLPHTHTHTPYKPNRHSWRFKSRAFLDRAQLNDFTLRCFCCFLWALNTKKRRQKRDHARHFMKNISTICKAQNIKTEIEAEIERQRTLRIVPQATSATATTTTIYQSFTRARVQERPVQFSKRGRERR